MKAFLAALLLFFVTVGGCHLYIKDQAVLDSQVLGTLPSEEKGLMRVALTKNMDENSLPIFGSSEFMHGADTPYHPAQVFAGCEFNPMLIGAGYYQSLSHAITLASIEGSLENRRAVLILSPQWFRKTGVVDQAYASRFSETHYAGAMENKKLSDETKQYISDRTQTLLQVDPKMQQRVLMYDDVLWKEQGNWLETMREKFWSAFLYEKELFGTMLLGKSGEFKSSEKAVMLAEAAETENGAKQSAAEAENGAAQMEADGAEEGNEPDWDALMTLAEQEGDLFNQNEFFIDKECYERLAPVLPKKKGISCDADQGYQCGPEFDDLRCFLRVCKELDIEPMIVIVPVNGYYYDYTEFPKEAREKYYEKVKGIAQEAGAEIADFSDQEYTKYFFEDRVHLGKKGWLMVDESIYEFYKKA